MEYHQAANKSTVAAAVAQVQSDKHSTAEALQLTDDVLANLTFLSLSNVSLFDFANGDSITSKRGAATGCKTFPGDAGWPSDVIWDVFDLLTGGALIKTVPLASPCYDSWGNYDAVECAYLSEQWTNSSLQ